MPDNTQKTNRRTMAIIRHMRRSAFSAGRPGGLIREITCRLSENSRKHGVKVWDMVSLSQQN
ncbi:hypothetical protein D7V94_22985, partial [Parablautia intestinalis]